MTYAVIYLKNSKIKGIPFACPIYSRQWFEEKKRRNIPCALMFRNKADQPAKLLDSFQIEILEQIINNDHLKDRSRAKRND
jgi:hypothetical protein